MENRKSIKINNFKNILLSISELSVSQTKKVACMAFTKNFSKISSFGYNGTYPNAPINPETGGEELSLEPGCSGFLHAEDNMIAKFSEKNPEDHIVFITLSPCRECTIRLVNAGFKEIYWIENYREQSHLNIFDRCNIKYGTIDEYIETFTK
jgi:deoxycytidylate deaminase